MLSSIIRWALSIVRPEHIIAGQTYSPLDTAAQVHSTEHVERFFATSEAAVQIGKLFSAFLDDDEAFRALKKTYLAQFEARARTLALRLDPPQTYGFGAVSVPETAHPLDAEILRYLSDLGKSPADVRVQAGKISEPVRFVCAIAMYASAFAFRTLKILLFGGGRNAALHCQYAAPDLAPMSEWKIIDAALRENAECAPSIPPLVVVCERGELDVRPKGEIPVVDPDDARIPRGKWLSDVIIPGLVLFAGLGIVMLKSARDARVTVLALAAMEEACNTIRVWQIAYTVRCAGYFDWVEYNSLHILRDIVLRKFGGGVVRWPHSSLYAPGVFTSYLGYSVFLSNGPYPIDRFARTWSKHTVSQSVGYLQFDRHYQSGNRVDPRYQKIIEGKISEGKRIVGYFCSSNVEGLPDIERETLAALKSALDRSDDWYLVVKPKSHNKQHISAMIREDARLAPWVTDENVLIVEYPESGEQVCSPGWLTRKMSLGAGILGSISAEAFCRSRPYFSYYPVTDGTEHSRRLNELGFLHHDLADFQAAIAAALDGKAPRVYDSWFFENFDPYRDDQALTRVVKNLTTERRLVYSNERGKP